MKRFQLYFLFILLIISTAYAGTYCAETAYEDSITVLNNYGSTVHYTITVSGSAAVFTQTRSETSFFLAKGESKTIDFQTFLAFPGDYKLNIKASDSKGGETNYNYDFNAVSCHLVNASILDLKPSYCANGGFGYTVVIENIGIHNESLNVNVGGYGFTTDLQVGETREYGLIFTPEEIGPAQLILYITNPYLQFIKQYDVNIYNCDSTTHNVSDLTVCEGRYYEHSFTLKNEGRHNDSYTFFTNSPVIELNRTSLELDPGEEARVYFKLFTACEDQGYKMTSVNVESELVGEIIVPIGYYVKNCYDQTAVMHNDMNGLCESDNTTAVVTLENTGTEPNGYDTSLFLGQGNATKNYWLNPGDKVNITLNYENIMPGVLQQRFTSISGDVCSSIINLEDETVVKEYNECYSGRLIVQPEFFDNNTKITVINNGTRENSYLLRIQAYNEIDNITVALPGGESSTFVLQYLMNIHDEYGVNSFKIIMEGDGAYSYSNTTYYGNIITGMIIRTATHASLLIGTTLLLILAYAYIRKK